MDDHQAIRRVLEGDGQAFEAVVRRYQRSIYNLMLRAAGDEQAAADLTQEAFIKAYTGLGRFDPSKRFFPWLYAVGLNLARDHLRRQRIRPATVAVEAAEADPEPCSEQELRLLRQAEARGVAEALGQLDLEHREALILRFQEELSLREVAEALGLSLSGAKMRVSRGLAKMKRLLVENGHEGYRP